jgi:hypothetical protein
LSVRLPGGIISNSITRLTQALPGLVATSNVPVLPGWAFWTVQAVSVVIVCYVVAIWRLLKRSYVCAFLCLHLLIAAIYAINGMPVAFFVRIFLVPFPLVLLIRPIWGAFDRA